ncbi:MAG: putative beta-lysine N-acetyltransferase [Kiritimatiellae bacterium]|jgi:putative beta-lysine N-acetyltransferase|nr:putative beta-lysine N-acetyltransferase [Kiritimatiellia bacterium]MDD4341284.1 putative beta-lysine N-acetyltransferase [Kiritimatiellia bacterium]MDY0149111.1 putative beta-lysine N-acetyltransferase [Kiritimatiellia bacterium]
MTDIMATIGGSLLQHGPNSRRVYLMKLDPGDLPGLHGEIERLVQEQAYGKVFAKVPESAAASFFERGYREEARIPGYFQGETDALLLGWFADPDRAIDRDAARTLAVLETARAKQPLAPPPGTAHVAVRPLSPADCPALAELYRLTFPSYPFPITEPAYLADTMATHIAYFGTFDGPRLVAASSAECDHDARAAEMTDFATIPECRGKGLARHLLDHMEAAMALRGIRTAYTIARANSFGMNSAFARAAYHWGGTLINNTGIGGGIESMNVWHKAL